MLIFLTADYADPADAGQISQELRAVFVYLPEVGGTLLATCYLLLASCYNVVATCYSLLLRRSAGVVEADCSAINPYQGDLLLAPYSFFYSFARSRRSCSNSFLRGFQ